MASQGPLGPSSGVEDTSVGNRAWSGYGNITADDSSYCTVAYGGSGTSYYVKASGFGFSIPSGATIDGILVEWKLRDDYDLRESAIRIMKGGAIGATNKSTNAVFPAESFVSYGSSSDLWGETWTYSDINASDFGSVFSAQQGPIGYLFGSINYVRITVYYTPGGGGAELRKNPVPQSMLTLLTR